MNKIKNIVVASLILATGLSAWDPTATTVTTQTAIQIEADGEKFFKNCYLIPQNGIKWQLIGCKLEKKECNHILVEIDQISKYTAEEQTRILNMRNGVSVGKVEVPICTGVYYE